MKASKQTNCSSFFNSISVANHFGAPVKDQSIESLRNNERLIAFLDDANINVLSASVEKMNDGSVKYHIDNVTHVGKANDKVLVLFKVRILGWD